MALAETARLVASLELQDKFSRPAAGIGQSLDGLERKATTTFGRIGSEAQRGLGVAAGHIRTLGTVAAGFAVTGLLISIRAASDLNEEIDKSAVVFGTAATKVQDFSTAAASIGLAKAEALGAAGAFGNMFNTIGFAQDESADMSITMVQLAADMASFNNEDPTDMLLRLRGGLAGEAEPLRRFGVLLSEATVREEAYATGIAAVGEELTEGQKVQARYSLILRQTAIQQGNYALTSESLANQQRTLRANLMNTAATIGTALLPKLAEFTGKLSDFVTENQPAIQAFADKLPAAFDKLVEFGGNLPWGAIGDAFRLMGTGSKALLDSFLGLPPWVQTAVLTGWGLNKLTGGALGSIVGALASGLIKGVLGITAGVVNINAGTVAGGGVGTGGGGGAAGGLLRGAAAATGIGAIAFGLFSLAGGQFTGQIRGPLADILGVNKKTSDQITKLTAEGRGNRDVALRASERRRSEAARALQAMNYVGQQQVAANSRLSGILAKPTSFTSNNNVTVNIDGRKVAGVITKGQFFAGTVPK